MYARNVADKELTFFVSGLLWGRSLVMQDEQTGSLWSHILGEAMDGELKGQKLESIPCFMTDWKTWISAHPETTVVMLDRTDMGFRREMYFRAEAFGLGLAVGNAHRFWRLDLLAEQPILNDELNGEKLLVVFDKASQSAKAYSRKLDDRQLVFADEAGQLYDQQTHSTWDWRTGRATAGKLAGQMLTEVPAIMTFGHAWLSFHPNTSRWTPGTGKTSER